MSEREEDRQTDKNLIQPPGKLEGGRRERGEGSVTARQNHCGQISLTEPTSIYVHA